MRKKLSARRQHRRRLRSRHHAPQPNLWRASGELFTQCSPSRDARDIPRIANSAMLYTRALRAFDLHAFPRADDAWSEWAERKLAEMRGPEALGTVEQSLRRVARLSVNDLIVVRADDPGLLSLAGLDPDEWDPEMGYVRHAVAATARRLTGVRGLAIPPVARAARPQLVVFAGFTARHVIVLESDVRPMPLSLPGRHASASDAPAEILELMALPHSRNR
jgi:hypothetical protein